MKKSIGLLLIVALLLVGMATVAVAEQPEGLSVLTNKSQSEQFYLTPGGIDSLINAGIIWEFGPGEARYSTITPNLATGKWTFNDDILMDVTDNTINNIRMRYLHLAETAYPYASPLPDQREYEGADRPEVYLEDYGYQIMDYAGIVGPNILAPIYIKDNQRYFLLSDIQNDTGLHLYWFFSWINSNTYSVMVDGQAQDVELVPIIDNNCNLWAETNLMQNGQLVPRNLAIWL